MKQEHICEIKAVVILAAGLILLASLVSFVPEDLFWYTATPNVPAHNLIRITGAYAAGSLLFIFGFSAYLLVVFLLFWSWNKFMLRRLSFSWIKLLSFIVLFCVISTLGGMVGPQEAAARFQRSGLVGFLLSDFLLRYVGVVGSYIILLMLGTLSLILTGEVLVALLFLRAVDKMRGLPGPWREDLTREEDETSALASLLRPRAGVKSAEAVKEQGLKKAVRPLKEIFQNKTPPAEKIKPVAPVVPAAPAAPVKPQIHIVQPAAQKPGKEEPAPARGEEAIVGEYRIPSLDLLQDPPAIAPGKLQSNLMNGAKLLEETLANFGVSARVAHIERGPAITRYELEPAPGVKVQKFTTLSDDIALAMRATTVRVVAPIPGKNRVGIEVPNSDFSTVYLKEVLTGPEFRSAQVKSKLTLSLGKDIAGKPMVADLAEMPHLLIAGTTGSGKTVCVNGLIMSMILSASPDEVKFVMIDPKMVELAQYNDIPHLLSPVVTDPQKAAAALHWVVGEMESRYRTLSKEGVRNLQGYNARGHKMPYIVVIIDELADLMQVSAKAVESAITRIAQLSRAVGIHLVLATQRPSVDVITGVIKANFPARISFKVASKVDSRTVLDMNGAESLLGKGDMLFIKPGDAKPTRGQCSYVRDDEIQRVIRFIKDQQAPAYGEDITKQQRGGGPGGADDQSDEYYDEAVRLVIESNQASVSILQRRLRLGYTRAARLIDMMEQNGIVGPYVGSKPRDILVDREQWLLENMKNKAEGDQPKA
ncbi:MAG: DNA translocase FtsK [Candidatus Omnitrophica bacterium]|nr:DNA translocase FtsK [Candidatus Omnitrophota bacterium]